MSADQVISASAWYDMMLGVENGREYKTQKAADMINRYAKTVNRNMRELEKAGYDFYAYDPARATLESLYGHDTTRRFKSDWTKESIAENMEEFMESARALRKFMRSDAHTVKTIAVKSRKHADFMIEKFFGRGMDSSGKPMYSKLQKPKLYERLMNPVTEEQKHVRREFERMLSGGTVSQLISEAYGNTDEVLEAAVYALEHGELADDLNDRLEYATEALTAYKEGTLDIEDLADVVKYTTR